MIASVYNRELLQNFVDEVNKIGKKDNLMAYYTFNNNQINLVIQCYRKVGRVVKILKKIVL